MFYCFLHGLGRKYCSHTRIRYPYLPPNMIRSLELSMWSVYSTWSSVHHYRSRKLLFIPRVRATRQNSDTCATRRGSEPRGVSAKQPFESQTSPRRVRGVITWNPVPFSVWLLHNYLWLPHTKPINHYFTRGCEQGPRMATCSSRVVSWLGSKQGCLFRHSVWVVSISLGGGTIILDHLPQKNNCFISMGSGICKWLETASVNLSTIYPPSRKEENPQKLETSI